MENSNKPSSSSVQDVEKKGLANKSTKMSSRPPALKTGKVFKKSLAKNTKKGPFKAKSAKKQAATLKKSTSSSDQLRVC